MKFAKYQHLEKIGHPKTDGLLIGTCHIFPKIDGTNSSVWLEDGEIKCGSRNRELSIGDDNSRFMAWAVKQENLIEYLLINPFRMLYGEWFVPNPKSP